MLWGARTKPSREPPQLPGASRRRGWGVRRGVAAEGSPRDSPAVYV